MHKTVLSVLACVVAVLAIPASAMALHENDPRSRNMVVKGHIEWPANVVRDTTTANDVTISDIAFWRNYAVQGAYDGFRFVDISNPDAPVEVSDTQCGASQGDITISPDGNVLVRSQDSARVIPGNDLANACNPGTNAPAGTPGGTTQAGFEGLQIFDTSNKAAPVFVKGVFTDFGSHTHTQYHDRANNRLIIYVSRSGSTTAYLPGQPFGGQNWQPGVGCLTAVEVPLSNPAGAAVVNRCIPAGTNGCHDVYVNEPLKRLYGACRPNMILYDISDPVNPVQLNDQAYPGITGWHSAAMSMNGQYLYAGWEPGGGTQPRCQATGSQLTAATATQPATYQTDAMKTIFVFRASDGALVGRWVLPQEQSAQENCTIHNYNIAPYPDRHILVGDGYQAGNFVVDFTNPNGEQVAFSDPPTIDLNPAVAGVQEADNGEWSTHWYNELIYASDIDEGINIWDLAEPWWDNALRINYLNPQTQTEHMRCTATAHGSLRANRAGMLHVNVRVNGQRLANIKVGIRGAGIRAKTVKTPMNGEVMFNVRPRRAGTIQIRAGALNVAGCSARRTVAAAPSRGGVAGGGAGLTGRPS